MALAVVPSCVLVIVNVSPEIAVTRTISALVVNGWSPTGHTVTLNGGVGNFVPSPVWTTNDVPVSAGDGAVATVEYAKFLCASGMTTFLLRFLGPRMDPA